MSRWRSALALVALVLAGVWIAACSSAPPAPPAEEAPPAAASAPPPPSSEEAGLPPELPAPEAPLPLPDDASAPAPPTWSAHVEDGEILVRVGLASDIVRYELPCCEGEVTVSVGAESLTLRPPLVIEPAASSVAAPERRLQVAALRDEGQAESLARSLGERTGWPGDVRFDASSGLYRVRVGRFATEPEVEAARRRVAGLGFGGAWPVQEGGELTEPALRVRSGESSFRVEGRWLVVKPSEPGGDGSLPVSTYERSGRYRGRLLVFLNPRGSLNLINELPLEQYLRGVVPRELGPALYPRLEALKAQAVAARTYTLRHLGEFSGEGFDICADPRCQVYGGKEAEHPLSDRAVKETAGEILLAGDEIIEALYSATCGGHTEDSRTVFPWLDASYLRGVPCPEGEAVRLAGTVAAGTPFPDGLTERLVPSPRTAGGREALQERLEALARTAGLPATGDRLRSLDRGEVRRYVRSVFDLVLDPSLLIEPGTGVRGGADARPTAVRTVYRPQGDARAAEAREVSGREAEWLMLGLARVLGLVEEEQVRFRGVEGGALEVAGGADDRVPVRRLELPADLATFALVPGTPHDEPTAAELALLPGDALVLYHWRGRLAAVVRDGGPDAPRPDTHPARASRFRTWSRFRSDRELAARVAERYPGLGFRGLEVLERGVSGRVGRLRILGDGGRSEVVEGLAVRWTLDLPDTRFEALRANGPGSQSGWRFTGGGWGHGVGMCQIGAYILAGRDLDYREILEHYYTGVRLGRARVR